MINVQNFRQKVHLVAAIAGGVFLCGYLHLGAQNIMEPSPPGGLSSPVPDDVAFADDLTIAPLSTDVEMDSGVEATKETIPIDKATERSPINLLEKGNDVLLPKLASPAEAHTKVSKALIWNELTPLEKAHYHMREGHYLLAERFFINVIESTRDREELRSALLQLADCYYAAGQYLKAIEIMESCFSHFPAVAADVEYIFRMGQFYRAAGLHEKAVSLFYQVINSIVVSGPNVLEAYMSFAQMSQFEIARTHYENREYRKAFEAFDRISVLNLTPENREIILYYKVLTSLKAARPAVGKTLIESFLADFPSSEYAPELMYLRAELLENMGQVEAAKDQLVQLLTHFEKVDLTEAEEFIFWKQQAGNRLANSFYLRGDYAVALRIYQGLVGLNEAPEWRLPVIYQMSLCFEKLKMYERAIESYTFLLEDLQRIRDRDQNRLLRQLKENASWRLNVVQWKKTAEADAASLLNAGGDAS
jgi:tetratricopeptide (TPR) repeat protein